MFAVIVLASTVMSALATQPVKAASGPLAVGVFFCPGEVDVPGSALGDLATNCVAPVAGASFTVAPGADPPVGFVTNGSGSGVLTDIPPGSGTIVQLSLNGTESRVFCSVQPQGSGAGLAQDYQAAENAISYTIADGEEMNCHWFNYNAFSILIQSEVWMQKYVCPASYDAGGAANESEIAANCSDVGPDFDFSVSTGGNDPLFGQTDGSGQAIITEVSPGLVNVVEGPSQYTASRVFCGEFDIGNPGLTPAFAEVDATGNQFSYDLAVSKGLSCNWYNYGLTSDSIINNLNLACPDGYDWSKTDYTALSSDCAVPVGGVTFSLSGPAVDDSQQTDNGGFVSWSVDPGDYTITETLPTEYDETRVFCGTYSNDDGPGSVNELDMSSYGFAFTLDANNSIDCSWFNLPEATGTMVVSKYECPEGYGPGSGYANLTASCINPLPGVAFTLTPGVGSAQQGLTDASGNLTYSDVAPGTGTLGESVSTKYNYVEVYCAVSDSSGDGLYQGYPITTTNVLSYSLAVGSTWSCSWYNLRVQAAPASLTINKFTCQPGYDSVDPNETLVAACNEPTDDINFTLSNEQTDLSASTGTGGHPSTISFSDLDPGGYVLTEDIPDSIARAFISECRSDARDLSAYPFSPFASIGPDGRVKVQLIAGENLECDWYNVLADTPGKLTLTKYWCEGNSVNASDCPVYTEEVGFTLTNQDTGEKIPFQTGDQGTATVEGTGSFALTEDDGQWCFAQSDAVDENGNIQLESGKEVQIEIYNCGPQSLN